MYNLWRNCLIYVQVGGKYTVMNDFVEFIFWVNQWKQLNNFFIRKKTIFCESLVSLITLMNYCIDQGSSNKRVLSKNNEILGIYIIDIIL